MHEFSIALTIVDELKRLLREHKATGIKTVNIEVGEYSNIVPELLRDAFNMIKSDESPLKETELKIEISPLKVRCRNCSQEWSPKEIDLRCINCGSTDNEVLQGTGILLREVILERDQNGKTHKG